MGINIEQSSLITLQNQLKSELLREIGEGKFLPGQKIYTEQQIRDMTGISLVTIKAALADLVKDGVLLRKQGKGTYVREKNISIEQSLNQLYSFIKDYSRLGYKVAIKVLQKAVVKISDHNVSSTLGLKEGDFVFKLVRVMSLEGEPIDLEYTYLPYNYFKGIEAFDFEKTALYEIMQKEYGVEIYRAKEIIEPIILDKTKALYLSTKKGNPALLIKRISFDSNGNIVEYTHTVTNGEKYKFSFELVKNSES